MRKKKSKRAKEQPLISGNWPAGHKQSHRTPTSGKSYFETMIK